jgi:quinol monooxygenase YgiN
MAAQSTPGWTGVVESAEKTEEGTLSYTVLVDEEKSCVRTIEAYESKEFLYGTHLKSPAIEANQKQNGELRTGVKDVYSLKMVAGYLYKEPNKA